MPFRLNGSRPRVYKRFCRWRGRLTVLPHFLTRWKPSLETEMRPTQSCLCITMLLMASLVIQGFLGTVQGPRQVRDEECWAVDGVGPGSVPEVKSTPGHHLYVYPTHLNRGGT